MAALAERRGDPAGGIKTEIGADQHVLDFRDGRGVELPLGDQVGDGATERRGRAFEPAGEALPPIAAWPCFRLAVDRIVLRGCLHAALVIAVSPRCATMTPEEMVSRLLYRDGLMLVIDKPAGFAVHHGPKGGESLEDYFDALRFGLPRAPGFGPPARPRYLRLPRARPPPQGVGELGKLFRNGADRQDLLGRGRGRARRRTKASSTCRSAASTTRAAGG